MLTLINCIDKTNKDLITRNYSQLFQKNKNNILNLHTLVDTDIIDNNGYFKDIISVPDGIYYYEEEWPIIIIENKQIISRTYCPNQNKSYIVPINDADFHFVFFKLVKNNYIFNYEIALHIDNNINLKCVMPNNPDALKTIDEFQSILTSSGYYFDINLPVIWEYIQGTNSKSSLRFHLGKLKQF